MPLADRLWALRVADRASGHRSWLTCTIGLLIFPAAPAAAAASPAAGPAATAAPAAAPAAPAAAAVAGAVGAAAGAAACSLKGGNRLYEVSTDPRVLVSIVSLTPNLFLSNENACRAVLSRAGKVLIASYV